MAKEKPQQGLVLMTSLRQATDKHAKEKTGEGERGKS